MLSVIPAFYILFQNRRPGSSGVHRRASLGVQGLARNRIGIRGIFRSFRHRILADFHAFLGHFIELVVEEADDTRKHDTEEADYHRDAAVVVRTEIGQRVVVRRDEHGTDNQQVVVQRDNRVEQGNQHQDIVSLLHRRSKDEELAEETGKWRNARQGEQGEHHQHAQPRVRLVEAVVRRNFRVPALAFHQGGDPEGRDIGKHVDHHVIDHAGQALRAGRHHAQDNVTGLRDGRVGEEAFDILLPDGEHVGNRDAEDDNDVQHRFPAFGHHPEHLEENREQGDCRRRLGYHREVSRNLGRSPLVDIGRPRMVRNQGHLEEQPGSEQDHPCDLQRRARQGYRHIAEIERPGSPVEQRHPEERNPAGKGSVEDELGTGFGREDILLAESHQASQGDGSQLDT